jgi:hypothetical protein
MGSSLKAIELPIIRQTHKKYRAGRCFYQKCFICRVGQKLANLFIQMMLVIALKITV